MMFVLLILTHVMLFYTRWGLRTRAVGENPHAADTLGINVIRTRWINVLIGGMIAGLAGAWLTLETTGTFDDNMTAGRGLIASSEEHTSELQSRENLVCRLLLEKKRQCP